VEIDELEAFGKHKRFLEDSLIYIEKLKNGSLAFVCISAA